MAQFSTTVRNAMLDAYETAVGASPKLRFLTGTAPANCEAAQTGTLLAELTLPADWYAGATSGTKAIAGTWAGTVSAAGTVAHYRIVDSAGTVCHEQGTVSTTGADMNIASTALTIGQALSVTSRTLTAGNA